MGDFLKQVLVTFDDEDKVESWVCLLCKEHNKSLKSVVEHLKLHGKCLELQLSVTVKCVDDSVSHTHFNYTTADNPVRNGNVKVLKPSHRKTRLIVSKEEEDNSDESCNEIHQSTVITNGEIHQPTAITNSEIHQPTVITNSEVNESQHDLTTVQAKMTGVSCHVEEIDENDSEMSSDKWNGRTVHDQTSDVSSSHPRHSPVKNQKALPKNKVKSLFKCDVCGFVSKYSQSMTRHKRIHGGKLKCDRCDRQFSTGYDLKCHIDVHHSNSFLECEECEKTFTSRHGLREHRKHVHDQHYSLKCAHCNHRGFCNKSHLLGHISQHFNNRPHSCEKCDKTFVYSWHLKEHSRKCAGPKVKHVGPFTCQFCDKVFRSKASRAVHVKGKHDEHAADFVCKCGRSFKWGASYCRHHKQCKTIS